MAIDDPTTGVIDQRRMEATIRAEKSIIGYDHLFHLLRVGASVFDYPGLLGLSRKQAIRPDGSCSVELGLYLRGWPSTKGRTDRYTVRFTKAGIITKIQIRFNPTF